MTEIKATLVRWFITAFLDPLTGRDDDYSAKEAYLSVGKLEAVDPLRKVKDGVHQRLGVPRRHLVDGILANDVAV